MKRFVLSCLFSIIEIVCFANEYNYPYSPFSERDPLRPLVNENGQLLIEGKKQFKGFSLQGIMCSSEGRSAVINDELYKEGDVVGGYTIQKIDNYEVILEKDEEKVLLKWEVYDEK